MARIQRRTESYSPREIRRRTVNRRIFIVGLVAGLLISALIFTLCFVFLGPVVYGPKPSHSEISSAGEPFSLPVSEPVSVPKPAEPSSAPEPSSEPPKEISSQPAPEISSETHAEIPSKPASSPVHKPDHSGLLSSAYLEDSVFIGDSITQGLGLYLPDLNATVLGVRSLNPNTVFTVKVNGPKGKKMTIPQAAVAYRPKEIYIMIGTNGLAFLSQTYMVDQLRTLIAGFQKQLPGCRIILESIPPVSREKYQSDHRFSVKNIQSYNAKLKKLAEERKISFLDVNRLFRDSQGYLPSAETPDGIHFYKKNYLKWLNFILEDARAYEEQQNADKAEELHRPGLPESEHPEPVTSRPNEKEHNA